MTETDHDVNVISYLSLKTENRQVTASQGCTERACVSDIRAQIYLGLGLAIGSIFYIQNTSSASSSERQTSLQDGIGVSKKMDLRVYMYM